MTPRAILSTLLVAFICAGVVVIAVLLRRHPATSSSVEPTEAARRGPLHYEVAEVAYDNGLGKGWRDWGWGAHDIGDTGPARIRFSEFGGIILHHDEVRAHFGAFVFRFRAPASYGDFLQVYLKYRQLDEKVLPRVNVDAGLVADLEDGWREAQIPWSILNPTGTAFDRVTIQARLPVGSEWILLDKVLFTRADGAGDGGAPTRNATLAIECSGSGSKPATRISPLIYGVAKGAWAGETIKRVGGNAISRLNWDLGGGVWNTGSDWYFENVKGLETGIFEWIEEAHDHRVKMAVTVPMLGWVAKDTTSVGFPISKFGPQRAKDPGRPEAGDGFRSDGKPIAPGPPTQTSVEVPPDVIRRWIKSVRQRDEARGARGVDMYILDNEPDLWNTTHRDVHPDPLSYDELLDRTLRYGAAIREADPEAVIAGPASWGWSGYFYSAKDLAVGANLQPDRRAHGGVPLLAWYLRELAKHEKDTGVRILDVLDVHFYPQAKGVHGNDTDPETSALRLRSTRALWDPTYKDESWIGESVNLIPRLKDWIAQNYPGRGISIGEWSFGAEDHMSGALAIAEALGRFGQQGITSAFYWFEIRPGTAAFQAFRAYRDFDGKGGHFLDWSVSTRAAKGVSLFASRDDATSQIVAVVLNLDPTNAVDAEIDLGNCGRATSRRVFAYGGGSSQLTEQPSAGAAASRRGTPEGVEHPEGWDSSASSAPAARTPATTFREILPPYSIKVIDLKIEPASTH